MKVKQDRGGILLTVLLFFFFTILLVTSISSIFFSSTRNELLIQSHYEAKTMLLLTKQYISNQTNRQWNKEGILYFNIGEVTIQQINDEKIQLTATLKNGYSEDSIDVLKTDKN